MDIVGIGTLMVFPHLLHDDFSIAKGFFSSKLEINSAADVSQSIIVSPACSIIFCFFVNFNKMAARFVYVLDTIPIKEKDKIYSH